MSTQDVATQDMRRSHLLIVGATLRTLIIFITALSVPLSSAEILGLSDAQTSTWILSLYGLSGLLSLVLTLIYRQPLHDDPCRPARDAASLRGADRRVRSGRRLADRPTKAHGAAGGPGWGTLLTYLLSRGLLGRRVPAIFPALVAGLLLAALVGQYGELPTPLRLDRLEVTMPVFTLRAILAATPLSISS